MRRAVAEQVRRARLRRIRAAVGRLDFEDAEELRHDDHRLG